MASSSSSSTSSVHKSYIYDVFLSFCGVDTRRTFVDHLYFALEKQGIRIFKDEKRLEKGQRINDELLQSIEDSRLYIIVFSKNYASSSWCLNELLKIMECQKTKDHIAYPVFYDVEPTEVRKQSGSVGEALSVHKNESEVGIWREALKDAANLSGWGLRNIADGHETQVIRLIVEEVSRELCSINYVNIGEKLVGIEQRLRDLESFLKIGVDDVRMIGIKGMGGAGKTTLARAIFDKLCTQFEARTFVREVSKVSLSGLNSLQKQVLVDVLKEKWITVSCVHDGINMMRMRLSGKKVLVVLDDVDHISQLEALAGDNSWFKSGSRIIITTRDEQVLLSHQVSLIHNVDLLSHEEATHLFSWYAFGKDIPVREYEKESLEVVCYAAGLPLTVKVLGSLLCGKDKPEWIDILARLKRIPLEETVKKLEISYESLEDEHKKIFLYVACFFKNRKKEDVIRMLDACGFHAQDGLSVLQRKSLITVEEVYETRYDDCLRDESQRDEKICIHDSIEEMAKNIVLRVLPDRHSRVQDIVKPVLWKRSEIESVLAHDIGMEEIRMELTPDIAFTVQNMKKHRWPMVKPLKTLILHRSFALEKLDHFLEELSVLSSCKRRDLPSSIELKCQKEFLFSTKRLVGPFPDIAAARKLEQLYVFGLRNLIFPPKAPKAFQLGNLVALYMANSRIVWLWEGGERKVLNNLIFLDLNHSKPRTFDLSIASNLKELNLGGCLDLVELYLPVEILKLKFLNLSDSKLRTLDLGLAPKLEELHLGGCHDLVELHLPVKILNLTDLKFRTIDLGLFPNLELLELKGCRDLVKLDMPDESSNVRSLKVSNSTLKTFDLGQAPNHESLNLGKWQLYMPTKFPNLTSINISHSKLQALNLTPNLNLQALSLVDCYDLVELHLPLKLKSLDLFHSKLKTLDLTPTLNLETLRLVDCCYLEDLCMPSKLEYLDLFRSKLKTLDLRQTLNLELVKLEECHDLVELQMPIACRNLWFLTIRHSKLRTLNLGLIPNLLELDLVECYDLVELVLGHSSLRTFDLGLIPNLEKLNLEECHDLVELYMPDGCPKLMSLELSHSKLATLDLGPTPNLERLNLQDSYHLIKLHIPIGCLKRLIFLNLSGCSMINSFSFIKELKSLKFLFLTRLYLKEFPDIISEQGESSLLELHFRCNNIEELPSSIANLHKLVYLDLHSCRKLTSLPKGICGLQHLRNFKLHGCSIEELPEDIDRLECLEKLNLSFTPIKHLPDSICMLKHLKTLNLSFCWNLEKLPEQLGGLECLQKLILIECTQVRDIPDSICKLKCLKHLSLLDCILLQNLPKELGSLKSLEVLNVEGTRIRYLPQSISSLENLKIYGPKGIRLCGSLHKKP